MAPVYKKNMMITRNRNVETIFLYKLWIGNFRMCFQIFDTLIIKNCFSDSERALLSATLPPFNFFFFISYRLRDFHVENRI